MTQQTAPEPREYSIEELDHLVETLPIQFACAACNGESQMSEAYGDCGTCDNEGFFSNPEHPWNWE